MIIIMIIIDIILILILPLKGIATVPPTPGIKLWDLSRAKVEAAELEFQLEQHLHVVVEQLDVGLGHVVLDEAVGPHPLLLGLQLRQHQQLSVARRDLECRDLWFSNISVI